MGDRAGQRRHCWVVLPDADPIPGVVAGWRRDEHGRWQARVAYALEDETGGSGHRLAASQLAASSRCDRGRT